MSIYLYICINIYIYIYICIYILNTTCPLGYHDNCLVAAGSLALGHTHARYCKWVCPSLSVAKKVIMVKTRKVHVHFGSLDLLASPEHFLLRNKNNKCFFSYLHIYIYNINIYVFSIYTIYI